YANDEVLGFNIPKNKTSDLSGPQASTDGGENVQGHKGGAEEEEDPVNKDEKILAQILETEESETGFGEALELGEHIANIFLFDKPGDAPNTYLEKFQPTQKIIDELKNKYIKNVLHKDPEEMTEEEFNGFISHEDFEGARFEPEIRAVLFFEIANALKQRSSQEHAYHKHALVHELIHAVLFKDLPVDLDYSVLVTSATDEEYEDKIFNQEYQKFQLVKSVHEFVIGLIEEYWLGREVANKSFWNAYKDLNTAIFVLKSVHGWTDEHINEFFFVFIEHYQIKLPHLAPRGNLLELVIERAKHGFVPEGRMREIIRHHVYGLEENLEDLGWNEYYRERRRESIGLDNAHSSPALLEFKIKHVENSIDAEDLKNKEVLGWILENGGNEEDNAIRATLSSKLCSLLGLGAFSECEDAFYVIPEGFMDMIRIYLLKGVPFAQTRRGVLTYLMSLHLWKYNFEGKKILDVGSGKSRFAQIVNAVYGKTGTRVVPIDKFIKPKGSTAMMADALQMPFGDREFDLTISNWLFPYFIGTENEAQFLDEVIRVTKLGGELRLTYACSQDIMESIIPYLKKHPAIEKIILHPWFTITGPIEIHLRSSVSEVHPEAEVVDLRKSSSDEKERPEINFQVKHEQFFETDPEDNGLRMTLNHREESGVSAYRDLSIHEIQTLDDLFPESVRNKNPQVRVISLGSGTLLHWEAEVQKRYGVEVIGLDNDSQPYPTRRHNVEVQLIKEDYFEYTPEKPYDAVFLNFPRIPNLIYDTERALHPYSQVIDKFLKPGGLAVIATDLAGPKAKGHLEEVFGKENVKILDTVEGFYVHPIMLHRGIFFLIKKPLQERMILEPSPEQEVAAYQLAKLNEPPVTKLIRSLHNPKRKDMATLALRLIELLHGRDFIIQRIKGNQKEKQKLIELFETHRAAKIEGDSENDAQENDENKDSIEQVIENLRTSQEVNDSVLRVVSALSNPQYRARIIEAFNTSASTYRIAVLVLDLLLDNYSKVNTHRLGKESLRQVLKIVCHKLAQLDERLLKGTVNTLFSHRKKLIPLLDEMMELNKEEGLEYVIPFRYMRLLLSTEDKSEHERLIRLGITYSFFDSFDKKDPHIVFIKTILPNTAPLNAENHQEVLGKLLHLLINEKYRDLSELALSVSPSQFTFEYFLNYFQTHTMDENLKQRMIKIMCLALDAVAKERKENPDVFLQCLLSFIRNKAFFQEYLRNKIEDPNTLDSDLRVFIQLLGFIAEKEDISLLKALSDRASLVIKGILQDTLTGVENHFKKVESLHVRDTQGFIDTILSAEWSLEDSEYYEEMVLATPLIYSALNIPVLQESARKAWVKMGLEYSIEVFLNSLRSLYADWNYNKSKGKIEYAHTVDNIFCREEFLILIAEEIQKTDQQRQHHFITRLKTNVKTMQVIDEALGGYKNVMDESLVPQKYRPLLFLRDKLLE
ncbi:MAG: class I SAM-dependent methyltransferase, partial [Deltaproteobacteria bacterium]|nr:class I SAM-dependent methyltransferase [Deltaproteobacteria bacterium]